MSESCSEAYHQLQDGPHPYFHLLFVECSPFSSIQVQVDSGAGEISKLDEVGDVADASLNGTHKMSRNKKRTLYAIKLQGSFTSAIGLHHGVPVNVKASIMYMGYVVNTIFKTRAMGGPCRQNGFLELSSCRG